MRNDVPAAIPLIALIAGLAAAPLLTAPATTAFLASAVLCFALRSRTAATIGVAFLFVSLGLALSNRTAERSAREVQAFASFGEDRFVTVVAPLDRGWSERGDAHLLRAERFRANGIEFDAPLAVYARFEPAAITMESHIRAEGFLKLRERGGWTLTVKSPELMAYEGSLPLWHPAAWNRLLTNRLERHAAAYPEEVALAEALVLGKGERLTQEMRDDFRSGGTYHLLVFSGLQIAFAAGLLAAALRWMHAPRASDWLLLAFAALAPLFIGPTASVARAAIAIGLYALSRLLARPTTIENLWCLAALLALVIEPRDLTDVSFHLTYAGAGALIFIGKQLPVRRWLAHVLAAETAITPLTLFHFRQYALGGALVTLLMAPVIFAMLIASAAACVAPGAAAFGAIRLLHRVCRFLNAGGVAGFFGAPPLHILLLASAGALLAIAMLEGRSRSVVLLVILLVPSAAAIVAFVEKRDAATPQAAFFDVGQGDALVLRHRRTAILVDGGPDDAIVRHLVDRGIRRIDLAVVTHPHPDHCVGVAAVLDRLEVGELWMQPRRLRGECAALLLESAARSRTPIHLVRDGDRYANGGIELLAHAVDYTFRHAPENNASIVLQARLGGRKLLLTGDIEHEAELHFDDRDFSADVLKVAHHGSRSSTSSRFLDSVQPRIAIISCGRRNLFGHPHPSVVDALRERGIRLWRTDRDHTIDLEVRSEKLYVTSNSH